MSDFKREVKYNQLTHEVEIYLDNSNGDSDNRKFSINPAAIVNLTIETDLSDWVTRGTMSFFYDPEAGIGINSVVTGQTTDATPELTKEKNDPAVHNIKDKNVNAKVYPEQHSGFVFRSDGDDLLRIKISPRTSDPSNLHNEGTARYSDYDVKDNDKFWTLSYLFSVYDAEDIDQPPGTDGAASASMKCLKLYFYDIRYQKMNSNLIEYSTALSNSASKASLSEKDAAIPTGIAMKEIIESSISGLSLNVAQLVGTGEEWEEGGARMFFTSPAYSTALDCLSYVHDRHVSSKKGAYVSPSQSSPRGGKEGSFTVNDVSLLTIERGPTASDVGYFVLRPMSWYFSRAGSEQGKPGELQTEHFFLQGYGTPNATNMSNTFRAPMSDNTQNVDIKSAKHNNISSYRFVDISPLTNSIVFRTRPVYSFDFSKRTFNVEFENNNVKKARDFISKQYINNMYRNKNVPSEDLFLITIGKDKINLSLTPTFSLHGEDSVLRQSDGIKKLIYTGIFQNACINFRVLGLPCRQVGQFIAIDRTDGVEPSPYNDKFYGQWFIISLRHVFEGELYYNDITAIKLHRFDKLPVAFVGTMDNYQ
jgi:hypothetical protein